MIAFDTNVLIYAVGDHLFGQIARRILAQAAVLDAIIPLQVLSEFANACRRKQVGDAALVSAHIESFKASFRTPATSVDDIIRATQRADRYQLQYFDALIATVASAAGASVLLSEDMQDGIRLGSITIVNPFAPANAALLADILDA